MARRLRTGMLWFTAMALAACGGGSSGGSSPPAPPPQVAAPSVDITASEATVLAGEAFDSQISANADGSATSVISVSCTNGVVPTTDGFRIEITAPVVSVLTESECTATVTDSSGRTASDTLTVTILPQTAVGQMVGIFDPPLHLALPNFNRPSESDSYGNHILTVAQSSTASGMYEIKAIEGTASVPRQYDRDDIVLVEGQYLSVDFVQSPSLFAHGLPDASLSVASEIENRIYWYAQDLQTEVFSVREIIEVNSPCFIAQTQQSFANDLVVGQVNEGLTVFDIDTGTDFSNTENFVATSIQEIGAGRSLCHILRGLVPTSIVDQYPGFWDFPAFDPAYALPLAAIDYNTLELVFFGDVDGDNMLDEMGAVPIETNATGPLDIVQVLSRGKSTAPYYFLVLLSDGNDNGEHRLVQINFDTQTFEISQQVLHEWSVGVPVSMLQGQVGGSSEGGQFRPDLVVVLGTTEQSFFFDNLLPLAEGFATPPLYGTPAFFDVGVGAGSAVAAQSPFAPDATDPPHGVLVSYLDTGYVFYISP